MTLTREKRWHEGREQSRLARSHSGSHRVCGSANAAQDLLIKIEHRSHCCAAHSSGSGGGKEGERQKSDCFSSDSREPEKFHKLCGRALTLSLSCPTFTLTEAEIENSERQRKGSINTGRGLYAASHRLLPTQRAHLLIRLPTSHVCLTLPQAVCGSPPHTGRRTNPQTRTFTCWHIPYGPVAIPLAQSRTLPLLQQGPNTHARTHAHTLLLLQSSWEYEREYQLQPVPLSLSANDLGAALDHESRECERRQRLC